MISAVNVPSQSIDVNAPIPFSSNRFVTGCSARHEQGSAIFTLTKPGIYLVTFTGTVSTTEAGTVVLNVNANGENVPSGQINVPTAAGSLYSVSITVPIVVYPCGSVPVSIVNASTVAVNVQDANIFVERKC